VTNNNNNNNNNNTIKAYLVDAATPNSHSLHSTIREAPEVLRIERRAHKNTANENGLL
jgi:hypothetical protein